MKRRTLVVFVPVVALAGYIYTGSPAWSRLRDRIRDRLRDDWSPPYGGPEYGGRA